MKIRYVILNDLLLKIKISTIIETFYVYIFAFNESLTIFLIIRKIVYFSCR